MDILLAGIRVVTAFLSVPFFLKKGRRQVLLAQENSQSTDTDDIYWSSSENADNSNNAFNEGTRLQHCIKMHKRLFGEEVKKVGGDTSYASNENRNFCKENGIQTSNVVHLAERIAEQEQAKAA